MNAPQHVPAEIIEAAARAEWLVQCEQSRLFTALLGVPATDVAGWDDVAEPIRERTRERVRPAVQAAWPMITALELVQAADAMEEAASGDSAWWYGDFLRNRATAQTTPTEETP